jgi:hypothetical protein
MCLVFPFPKRKGQLSLPFVSRPSFQIPASNYSTPFLSFLLHPSVYCSLPQVCLISWYKASKIFSPIIENKFWFFIMTCKRGNISTQLDLLERAGTMPNFLKQPFQMEPFEQEYLHTITQMELAPTSVLHFRASKALSSCYQNAVIFLTEGNHTSQNAVASSSISTERPIGKEIIYLFIYLFIHLLFI